MEPLGPFAGIEAAWFTRPDGRDHAASIHGLGHTARVRIHAMELADAIGLSDLERTALAHAAAWHDIGRTNDGVDYYHGAKSAGKAVGLGLHRRLSEQVVALALFAVTHHSGSEEHAMRAVGYEADPKATARVFQTLKDADGLDRVRIHDLDPSYLRWEVSRTRVDSAWRLLEEIP